MANRIFNLKSGTFDDFINIPSGVFYVNCRVEGSKSGFSNWGKPVKITWTNDFITLPDEYFQKQEAAFDLVKEVALECKAANLPVEQELIDMERLVIETTQSYVSPVSASRITFRISAASVMGDTASLDVRGNAYGDTFIATVTLPRKHDGQTIGHFQATSGAVLNMFNLERSHGKFVMDYSNGDKQFWIAYEGETLKKDGVFYCIKKESTIRRNVTIDLSY